MIRTADWQLTAEAFGGLLVERSTFREFEIGQLEYIFAKLMLKGYSSTSISAQLKKRLKSDFSPSKELLELLSSDGSKADTCHLAKDLSDALNELAEVKSLDHLAAPTEITIYPTMKCQLSCSFCFVRDKKYPKETLIYLPKTGYHFAETWLIAGSVQSPSSEASQRCIATSVRSLSD